MNLDDIKARHGRSRMAEKCRTCGGKMIAYTSTSDLGTYTDCENTSGSGSHEFYVATLQRQLDCDGRSGQRCDTPETPCLFHTKLALQQAEQETLLVRAEWRKEMKGRRHWQGAWWKLCIKRDEVIERGVQLWAEAKIWMSCAIQFADDLDDADEEIERQETRAEAAEGRVRERGSELLRRGGHDHCGQTTHPHMHRGVDCDESHPCDCGWTELRGELLAEAKEGRDD